MRLTSFDLIVILCYLGFSLAIGLYLRRRATRSVDDFFVSGREVTWWLAGTSMVATTFAADTPLVVAGLVARNGIAGNWVWWSLVASGILTVFVYARLWRRAGVLTDVEFAEIRYSGRPAAFLRGFRAIYLGLPVNLIIMGWVNLAMVKILQTTLGVTKLQGLLITLGIMALTAAYASLSGLWGVLWTDLFQFTLMVGMAILLAVFAVAHEGGPVQLYQKVAALDSARGSEGAVLSFLPSGQSASLPLITFFAFIAVNWWASWYPGAEPGGGGYVAQRIFCAKNEKHSVLATLWFNIAHYAIRPWPWILVGLVAVVRYQDPATAADPESGYLRVMLDDLPLALRGLMLAGFLAAYMSTIATQLNWGTSYLINDLYRRFVARDREKGHYVAVSQVVTVTMMLLSAVVTFYMDSIAGAWQFLMALGAGTGLVYILRWFWWRINAWSEISAMAAAFIVSLTLRFGFGFSESDPRQFAAALLITTAITTSVWLVVTLITPAEPNATLLAFYRRVRPNPRLWGAIPREAVDTPGDRDGLFNLANWAGGIVLIYAALFGVGKIVLGEFAVGGLILVLALAAGAFLYWNLERRGWATLE